MLYGADINIPADAATRQKYFYQRLWPGLFWKNGCDRAKVYSHDKSSYEIAGVFQDYKHRNYEQPYPLLVWVYNEIQGRLI